MIRFIFLSRLPVRAICVSLPALAVAGVALGQERPEDANSSAASSQPLADVVVSGTRIVRDGYSAPTPVSVLTSTDIENEAVTNVADALNRLPQFSGSTITSGAGASFGTSNSGENTLNLRGLGTSRTLVLLDGKRLVGGNFSGDAGAVDINVIPDNLIQRVDVVTGGASAVYGSDALAGVVNFVLDKNFTGIKGNVEGNVTTFGDDPGYQLAVAVGEPFADGRGHVLFSTETVYNAGIEHNDRPWNAHSYSIFPNPSYAAGNGLPQYVMLYNTGSSISTPGGLITSGPLKGTMFGAGGAPETFQYGPVVSGQVMSGGDWQDSRFDNLDSLDLRQQRTNVFGRLSYDVTDNVNAFVELGWSYERAQSLYGVSYFHLGNVTIQSGNPFIPASVQAVMIANNIQSFTLGTTNADESTGFDPDNARTFNRVVAGLEGKVSFLDSIWNWNVYFERSSIDVSDKIDHDENEANYTLAVDAVVNPANGQIVCRSSLTSPNNGCVPYNPMGIGVNSQAALNYIQGTSYTAVNLTQTMEEASITGNLLKLPAGPVALALDFAHREESTDSYSTPIDQIGGWFAGNFAESAGSYSVTEGALETDIPILRDVTMAKSLDINAAARATEYSSSGYVTTWKGGVTYKPLADLSFRLTQSRDIREPTLSDLYNGGTSGGTTVIESGQSYFVESRSEGNPLLQPEKANSTGAGFVFTPTFMPGFGMSVDYYDIKINGAIVSLSAQSYVNLCDAGNQQFCSFIERDASGAITTIFVKPANFQVQSEQGVDFEVSYRFMLSDLVAGFKGGLSFRALATFINSLETIGNGATVQGAGVLGDYGGIGTTGLTAPKWKYTSSVTYDLDKFSATLYARGMGEGVYNPSFITCLTNCPVSTAANPTVSNNHIPSWTALDLSLNYSVLENSQFYLTVQNLLNRNPPIIASSTLFSGLGNAAYDQLGRVFRVGFRFRF